jgi:hypothetical protein
MGNKTAETPRVGVGSKPGVRFFITQFPELRITVKPADVKDVGGQAVQVKGEYAMFTKMQKPWDYKGRGRNNTATRESGEDLGDANDPVFWGLLVVDGRTKEGEALLTFLRGHQYYKRTVQDNECERMPLLKELDWDPATLLKTKPRRGSHGVDVQPAAEGSGEEEGPQPPADGRASAPRGRTGLTGN